MQIPNTIVAGDSVQWRDIAFRAGLGISVSSLDYTLTYSFRGPVPGFDLAGTPQGSGWDFALTTEQSAKMNPGGFSLTWYWTAVALKDDKRYTAGTGTTILKPNLPALQRTYDGRSEAEQNLQAVRNEISARVQGGATVEYTIGTRSLKKEPIANLLVLEQRYMRQVARERKSEAIKNGLGNPSRIGVRFK